MSASQQLKPSTSLDSLEGVPSSRSYLHTPSITTVDATANIITTATTVTPTPPATTGNTSTIARETEQTILSTHSLSSLASLSTVLVDITTPSTSTSLTLRHNHIGDATTTSSTTETKSTNTLSEVTIFSPPTTTSSSTSLLPITPTKVDDDDDGFDTKQNDHQVEEMSEAELDALYGDDEHLFSVGDHVRVYKRALGLWPFYHHGIVTAIRVVAREGRPPRHEIEKIVHFTHRNHRQRQVICETNLAHFAHGALDTLQPVHHDNSRYPLLVAAKRARQKIGCTRYHPVQRNCEHFATWCHTGRENSAQIRSYAQMAIALSWGAVLGLALNSIASSDASSSSSGSSSSGSAPK